MSDTIDIEKITKIGVEGLAELAAEPPEEEEASEAEEPQEEVYIIEIKGHGKFFTNNEKNGDIYAVDGADEDVGDQVGKFVNSVAIFS